MSPWLPALIASLLGNVLLVAAYIWKHSAAEDDRVKLSELSRRTEHLERLIHIKDDTILGLEAGVEAWREVAGARRRHGP